MTHVHIPPRTDTLYVVAVISNPIRYQSRYRLFKEFEARMLANPHVQLVIVEQAFGDRPYVVTNHEDKFHVRIREGRQSEVWVKESLVNIGFRHLSRTVPNWKYAAWIDADIEFLRPTWAEETMEALQHWKIVQPWTRALDMGPDHMPMGQAESFCYSHWQQQGQLAAGHNPSRAYCGKKEQKGGQTIETWHPGFAWAFTREVWENVMPLIDWCPMGAGDHHMAWAFAEMIERAVDSRMHDSYKRRANKFETLCKTHLKRNIGFTEGTVMHHYHGKKKNRFYVERAVTLLKSGFNPDTDIDYNHDGLLILTGHNLALRDGLKHYFRSRAEDATTND